MNLLVDLGNSRVKWAVSTPNSWRLGSVPAHDIPAALDMNWPDLPVPTKIVIASVADQERCGVLTQWIARRWSLAAKLLEPQREQAGVKNLYRDPAQLGADRWAALIGARQMTQTAACVVDCGTAITVDALSPDGEFRGGVILPGLALMRRSLAQGTSGIVVASGDDSSCMSLSTADGVAAGTLFGLAGAIDRLILEQRRSVGRELSVFVTGGDAPIIAAKLQSAFTEVPDLVLRGLARVAEAS